MRRRLVLTLISRCLRVWFWCRLGQVIQAKIPALLFLLVATGAVITPFAHIVIGRDGEDCAPFHSMQAHNRGTRAFSAENNHSCVG